MEETIDLLTAYYTALLEKGYINHRGKGTPLIKSDNPKYYYFVYLLAGPNDWGVPNDERMDRESIMHMVEDGYYFWVSVSDTPDTWNWVRYMDGHWETEAGRKIIPENKMQEIIRRSADKLGLELEHASELSKAARLLDDEMQYEI